MERRNAGKMPQASQKSRVRLKPQRLHLRTGAVYAKSEPSTPSPTQGRTHNQRHTTWLDRCENVHRRTRFPSKRELRGSNESKIVRRAIQKRRQFREPSRNGELPLLSPSWPNICRRDFDEIDKHGALRASPGGGQSHVMWLFPQHRIVHLNEITCQDYPDKLLDRL